MKLNKTQLKNIDNQIKNAKGQKPIAGANYN